jgi:hypothetical protein
MPIRSLLAVGGAALYLVLSFGCGGDNPTEPPPPPEPERPISLFHEPQAFCLPFSSTSDTLFLSNLGDSTLAWRPVRVPAGSVNLDRELEVESQTTVGVIWEWAGTGSYPRRDTLIAETDDPALPRVVIPFRRVGIDYVDEEPPPAPVLFAPEDGATFTAPLDPSEEDSLTLRWSRVCDCTGIQSYTVFVASDPELTQFLTRPLRGLKRWQTSAKVYFKREDRGTAYWGIQVQDKAGHRTTSESRSWVIE